MSGPDYTISDAYVESSGLDLRMRPFRSRLIRFPGLWLANLRLLRWRHPIVAFRLASIVLRPLP